jgi:hypothetical protein
MADREVPLKDTIEAFVFFRTMVLDSADPRSWGPMLELADRVLVGMVEGYQRRLAHPQSFSGRTAAQPFLRQGHSYYDQGQSSIGR